MTDFTQDVDDARVEIPLPSLNMAWDNLGLLAVVIAIAGGLACLLMIKA